MITEQEKNTSKLSQKSQAIKDKDKELKEQLKLEEEKEKVDQQVQQELKNIKKKYDEKVIIKSTWAVLMIFLAILSLIPTQPSWVLPIGLTFLFTLSGLFRIFKDIKGEGVLLFPIAIAFGVFSVKEMNQYPEQIQYVGIGVLIIGILMMAHGLLYKGKID